jgi:hypothetical protein
VLDPTQELRAQVGKHLVRRHRHNGDRPVFDLVAREVMTDVDVLCVGRDRRQGRLSLRTTP